MAPVARISGYRVGETLITLTISLRPGRISKLNPVRIAQFVFDPVGNSRPSPAKLSAPSLTPEESRVIAVASTYPGLQGVMRLTRLLPAIPEIRSTNSLIVTRRSVSDSAVVVFGRHQAHQAFNAIVNVHERSCLFAVAPDFDLSSASATLRKSRLAPSLPPSYVPNGP